jgi:protein associated with RNAse G/E
MPYKSLAQAAYFNIHKKQMEKEGVDVDEYNAASKGMKLPKHADKKVKLKVKKKQ